MKLTDLHIHGFKSFADKMQLHFDDGVTGIVGPNGCGKSNVIDAFRWVLGEQKTKNLRSDKMEMVIFNGTKARKKSNYAEVSISFDNTKNILPTEYSSVKITRKLYRDGDSEYRINDVTCRLKDITNLFLDTGIGPDSYAIIELGMVSDILTDKNNARRQLLEEAAGISKYKLRKKETFNRLKATEEALDRVEDLLFEIEKQLKTLERQAKRAIKYRELKAEYKRISLQFTLLENARLITDKKKLAERIQKISDERSRLNTNILSREAEIEEFRLTLAKDEEELAKRQKALNAFSEEIRQKETAKSVRTEKLKYLEQRQSDLQTQLQSNADESKHLEKHLEGLESQVAEAQKIYNEEAAELKELEAELEELRESVDAANKTLEQYQADLREREQALQKLEKEKGYKEIQIQGIVRELERSSEDADTREEELSDYAKKLDELAQRRAQTAELLEQLEADQERIVAKREELNTAREGVREELTKLHRKLDAQQNEYQLTKSLVESLEGFPESVKFLAKDKKWAKSPVLLSDIFDPEAELKVALETYLEPYMSYYVVRSRAEAMAGVDMLRNSSKGRARFFLLDGLLGAHIAPLPERLQAITRPMLDAINYDERYEKLAQQLLGNVHVLTQELPEDIDIPEGVVLLKSGGGAAISSGEVHGGSVGLFQGKRIGRAKNLEKLGKAISKLKGEISTLEDKHEALGAELDGLKHDDTPARIKEQQKQLNSLDQEKSVLETRQQAHKEFLARHGKRKEDLHQEIEKLKADIVAIEPQTRDLQSAIQTLDKQVAQAKETLTARNRELSDANSSYTDATLAFVEVKNRLGNYQKEYKNTQERIERNAQQREQLQASYTKAVAETDGVLSMGDVSEDEIVALYKQKQDMTKGVDAYADGVNTRRETIRRYEQGIREERKQIEALNQQYNDAREAQGDLDIKLNGLDTRLEYEFDLKLEQVDEAAVFADTDRENLDADQLDENIQRIRKKLNNYGEVNMTAIEQFDEVKNRYEDIIEQRDDLMKAKQNLLDTIDEIDQEANARFLETFREVQENFSQVFRTLFSEDDHAELRLKDSDNPLDSAIDILAMPKGKRPLSISQLSGGEKTLTAISLLFSIYLIKPAPFCIFDEVDAPLDDANIDKFNNIIRDFSKDSQFIIVTHNKRTMVHTNVIYGVTMEQTGISRVLPVDLQALQLESEQ